MRQLAAHGAVPARLGCQVPIRRSDHRRRAHPGVRLRADSANVTAEVAKLGVTYPVAVDDDYGVWRAFGNHFWPAVYLADAEGRIRFHHFGEGEYGMTEMVIQQLLHDAGATQLDLDLVDVEPRGLEVAADWRTLRTPESYLGYRQANAFAQEDVARFDEPAVYRDAGRLPLNAWGLRGTWTVARPRGRLARAGRPDRLPVPGARRQPRDGSGDRRDGPIGSA